MCYVSSAIIFNMHKRTKTTQQIVHLSTIVGGHIIHGTVTYSPAPEYGIMSELAKFEAERMLTNLVEEEIAAGRL